MANTANHPGPYEYLHYFHKVVVFEVLVVCYIFTRFLLQWYVCVFCCRNAAKKNQQTQES